MHTEALDDDQRRQLADAIRRLDTLTAAWVEVSEEIRAICNRLNILSDGTTDVEDLEALLGLSDG